MGQPRQNNRGVLKSQSKGTKPCTCGRGTVYTGDYTKHNPVVDGKRVCEECMIDHIYAKYRAPKDGE